MEDPKQRLTACISTGELERRWKAARELMKERKIDAFLQRKGYQPELRLYAHGQGYALVERPFFLADETLTIQPGMNLTIHPTACNDRVWAGICDNYLMAESGPGECLHRTPKEIIVVS